MEITKADKRDCGGRNHSISNFPTFVFSNARSFLHFSGSLQGKNKEYQGKKLVG